MKRIHALTAGLIGAAIFPVALLAWGGNEPDKGGEALPVTSQETTEPKEAPSNGENAPNAAPKPEAIAKPALPPLLSDDPPGPEKTPRPKVSEWKAAPVVRFARMADTRCKARRIREWVEVRCSLWGEKGFTLIAGSREGIDVRMDNMSDDPSITLEFPVRRGDARVFQIDGQAGKYGTAPEVIISERWGEADPAPVISVTSAM
jgi:hypothetical protein